MEVTSTFTICVFFALNTLFMLYLMNLPGIDLQPSFISSTEKDKDDDDFSDVNDASLKKSISNYFKTNFNNYESEKIGLNDKFSKIKPEITATENVLDISSDTKVSMFLEQTNQEEIYVIKLNHDQDPNITKKEPKYGLISLYSVDARALTKNDNYLDDDLLLKKCWSTKIYGRVIGVVTSENKKSVAIYYRIARSRKDIDYRIRFIHNLNCDLLDSIETSDYESRKIIDKYEKEKLYLEKYLHTLDKHDDLKINEYQQFSKVEDDIDLDNEVEDIFHIENNEFSENSDFINQEYNEYLHEIDPLSTTSSSGSTRNKNSKLKYVKSNYFDEDSYDDFILPGNLPISYISIQKDILAYTRDNDDFQFRILKKSRQDNQNYVNNKSKHTKQKAEKSFWIASALGPAVDKSKFAYFHTNSIKLVPDPNNDYRVVHIDLGISQTLGVVLSGKITVTNHVNNIEDLYNSTSYESNNFFSHKIDSDIIDKDLNIEKAIKNLKQYMKPTIFSNTNKENLFFEIYNSTILISMDWNKEDVQFQYLFELKSKINRIYSDPTGENILVKFDDCDDLVLIKRKKIVNPNENEDFYSKATPYSISLKKIPERLRYKKFISFSLENIDDKIILFALNEDGVFFTLDLS